ncbi:hypothetical protein Ami103574_08710 [Aminipila butyrica]|uniref:Uncharacterized protein n=1 Tax=Aminipila butyrica TaxID=433296 RepID=A0A858BTZ1_9FIRM|nr:hypothetical protein [Aminipila butyrica]QIB69403.1 hypothetical protein Ami103574_08710 [Aminipila butyrica]
MKKRKRNGSAKIVIYRLITAVVVLCLTLLTFLVVTNNKDGRRQIVDENGGFEVSVPGMLSEDEENGGSVQ